MPPQGWNRTFRPPLAGRLLSLFGTGFLALTSLAMVAITIAAVAADQWPVGLVTAACAAWMIVLTRYVGRDLVGKWGLRVGLTDDGLDLDLPAHRSLIHPTPRQRMRIAWADITGLETRLEAYTSFGAVMMQRLYVLVRRDGEPVVLFEDRALGTGLASEWFPGIALDIADRAGVTIRDLGMTKGSGGVLGVVHTHAADWSAPALSPDRQRRLWRRAVATGQIAFLLLALAFLFRAIFR